MDRRLRDLERQASLSPEAGAAYAQALARSGERREAFLLWCRLAREGSDAAGRALDAWPRLRSGHCAYATPPPADPHGATTSDASGRVVPLPGPGVCAEATATTLYVRCSFTSPARRQHSRTVAVDLVSGRQGWVSEEGELPLACCGDDLLLRRGAALLLRDHRDGHLLGELTLAGDTTSLSVDRDRLVTIAGSRTWGYDLGAAFGARLWDRATGSPSEWRRPNVVANAELFYSYSGLQLEVSDLETGLTRWRERRCFLLPSTLGKRHGSFLSRGDGGLWVRTASSDSDPGYSTVSWIGGDQRLALFSHPDGPADGGSMAAGFPQAHLALIGAGSGRVVYARMVGRSIELIGLERSALARFDASDPDRAFDEATGRAPLWSRPVERVNDLRVQGDRVFLLVLEDAGLVVRVLDAASGRQRYRVRVKTEAVTRWPLSARLVPVGGDELLVALCSKDELHLIRIGLRG